MLASGEGIAAVIVHTELSPEIVSLLRTALEQAGFAPVRIVPALPSIVPQPCFLVLDETVGGVEVTTLLPSLAQSATAVCVLVSAPYVEKIRRLKFDTTQEALADVVIIKGAPQDALHLDMSITATSEPQVIAVLFRRIAKSLRSTDG